MLRKTALHEERRIETFSESGGIEPISRRANYTRNDPPLPPFAVGYSSRFC